MVYKDTFVVQRSFYHKQNVSKTFLYVGIFFFALSYAYILAFVLPFDGFKDRLNYLNYASNSWFVLQNYYEQGFLAVLANEPFWLMLNISLGRFLDPIMVVRVIIFVSCFLSVLAVSKILIENKKTGLTNFFIFSFLVFAFPGFLKNFIVHLRQGLAMSLFLAGWSSRNVKLRWLFVGITPFVHASFFLVLLIYFSVSLLRYFRLPSRFPVFFVFIGGVLIGSSLKYIATLVNARQAYQYGFHMTNVSGLGFIYWMIVLSIFLLESRRFLRQHSFEISGISFYLATYFLVEVTARVFESILPLVLLAGLDLTRWRKQIFVLLLVVFVLLSYILRISEPRLGFGV